MMLLYLQLLCFLLNIQREGGCGGRERGGGARERERDRQRLTERNLRFPGKFFFSVE